MALFPKNCKIAVAICSDRLPMNNSTISQFDIAAGGLDNFLALVMNTHLKAYNAVISPNLINDDCLFLYFMIHNTCITP